MLRYVLQRFKIVTKNNTKSLQKTFISLMMITLHLDKHEYLGSQLVD